MKKMEKKVAFVVTMFVLFLLVMVATPAEELGYNFPLDEGGNKLAAGFIALVASLYGAIASRARMIMTLVLMNVIEVFAFGCLTGVFADIMFVIATVMAMDADVKDFILAPFKDDEKKDDK